MSWSSCVKTALWQARGQDAVCQSEHSMVAPAMVQQDCHQVQAHEGQPKQHSPSQTTQRTYEQTLCQQGGASSRGRTKTVPWRPARRGARSVTRRWCRPRRGAVAWSACPVCTPYRQVCTHPRALICALIGLQDIPGENVDEEVARDCCSV